MITFTAIHPKFTQEAAGLLPDFFDLSDPRPAREQLNSNYQHGGGWRPQPGWRREDDTSWTMIYPGDPSMEPIAYVLLPLSRETIYLYPHSYVCIVQQDKSFEMGRVD